MMDKVFGKFDFDFEFPSMETVTQYAEAASTQLDEFKNGVATKFKETDDAVSKAYNTYIKPYAEPYALEIDRTVANAKNSIVARYQPIVESGVEGFRNFYQNDYQPKAYGLTPVVDYTLGGLKAGLIQANETSNAVLQNNSDPVDSAISQTLFAVSTAHVVTTMVGSAMGTIAHAGIKSTQFGVTLEALKFGMDIHTLPEFVKLGEGNFGQDDYDQFYQGVSTMLGVAKDSVVYNFGMVFDFLPKAVGMTIADGINDKAYRKERIDNLKSVLSHVKNYRLDKATAHVLVDSFKSAFYLSKRFDQNLKQTEAPYGDPLKNNLYELSGWNSELSDETNTILLASALSGGLLINGLNLSLKPRKVNASTPKVKTEVLPDEVQLEVQRLTQRVKEINGDEITESTLKENLDPESTKPFPDEPFEITPQVDASLLLAPIMEQVTWAYHASLNGVQMALLSVNFDLDCLLRLSLIRHIDRLTFKPTTGYNNASSPFPKLFNLKDDLILDLEPVAEKPITRKSIAEADIDITPAREMHGSAYPTHERKLYEPDSQELPTTATRPDVADVGSNPYDPTLDVTENFFMSPEALINKILGDPKKDIAAK